MISVAYVRKYITWSAAIEPMMLDAIKAVVAEFEAGTNRVWTFQATDVEEIELEIPEVADFIFTRIYPAESVSLTEFNYLPVDALPIDPADYSVDLEAGVIRRRRRCHFKRFVTVTSTNAGYKASETYDGKIDRVRRAIALEVGRTMLRDAPEKITLTSQSIQGSGTTVYVDPTQRHPEFERVLVAYRRYASNV